MSMRVCSGNLRLLLALGIALAAAQTGWTEPRWKLQYIFDEDKQNLAIADLKFSSAKRGIAVGMLEQKRGTKPTALITSDGGEHWTAVALPDEPRSVFLLNDSAGWLVGDSGVWFSSEGGRNWKRILKNRRLVRVFFVTQEHGYAIGAQKTVLETMDGGLKWTEVPAAKEPSTTEERTLYNWVDFWNPSKGMIVGRSSPVQHDERIPLWMDTVPEYRRELPAITIFLQTTDGGKNWKISQNTIFGNMTRFMVDTAGRGIGLIEYTGYGKTPSEVLRLDERKKSFETVYSDAKHFITDVALINGGAAYAAGIEVRGKVAVTPIPTKVRVLQSGDLQTWTEMKVDYRASATRVYLTAAGNDIWMATDTGMILKLVSE